MKLRIVAGSLKGRVITLSGRDERCRPTLERQRESVAQMLTGRIEGARALDLCAGSGAMGFELLSRGAAHVDFVEVDRGRARSLEACAAQFDVTGRCTVWSDDLRQFLRRSPPAAYDIVYFDPPYEDRALNDTLGTVLGLVTPEGVAFHERSIHASAIGARCEQIHLVDTRGFGMTAIDIYAQRPLRGRPTPATATGGNGGSDADRDLPGDI